MSTASNIEVVKNIYAAFGRGDVPAILEVLHPDVEWEIGAVRSRVTVPWLAPGRGREAAVAFFGALRENLVFKKFEVLAVMGDGAWVVGLVALEAEHTKTGKTLIENCETHVWKLDDAGRVVGMRHGADSLHHAEVAGLI